MGKFTFVHGVGWIAWVVIIFSLAMVILIFVMFPHLVTVLEAFGLVVTDTTEDALFWLLTSIIFISALRGAKVHITLSGDKDG